MLNMVWGSVTAYMGIDSLTPLVKDLKTALGDDSQVEVTDLEISGKDAYSVRFTLKTIGDVSESSVMDAAKAISRSDGCVYFMDARSMSVLSMICLVPSILLWRRTTECMLMYIVSWNLVRPSSQTSE